MKQLAVSLLIITLLSPSAQATYLPSQADLGIWSLSGDDAYKASGNIGIGTNNPAYKLDIQDTATNYFRIMSTGADTSAGVLMINDARNWATKTNGDDKYIIRDVTAGEDRLTIDTSGNVGIGTVTPGAKFEIQNTGQDKDQISIIGDRSYIFQTTDELTGGRDLRLYGGDDNNKEYLYFSRVGSVGIGTTAPEKEFHIYQDAESLMRITGAIDNIAGIDFGDVDATDIGYVRYYNTDNSLRFRTNNNAPNLVIDSSGSIGIGTTSPELRFHTLESNSTNVGIFESTHVSNDAWLWLVNPASRTAGGYNDVGLGAIDRDLIFRSGDATRMAIQGTTGNVGIGTTGPNELLHVYSATTPQILVEDSTNNIITRMMSDNAYSAGFIGTESNHELRLQTNSTTKMTILADGNVGIGTTSPGEKLTVLGGNIVVREDDDGNDAVRLTSGNASGQFQLQRDGTTVVELNGGDGTASYINNGGNFGIGMTGPSRPLEVNNTSYQLRLSASNTYTDFSSFDAGAGNQAILDINPIPATGTDDATIRLFRDTETTGSTNLVVLKGNKTTTENAKISGSGNTYFAVDNGNVGVGTTNPNDKLTVVGSMAVSPDFSVDAPYNFAVLNDVNTNNHSEQMLTFHSDRNDTFAGIGTRRGVTSTNIGLSFWTWNGTATGERMTIDPTGNVGIGTAGPTEQLEIYNGATAGNAILALTAVDNNGQQWNLESSGGTSISSGSFGIKDDNSGYRFMINGSGDVGIGTTTPTQKLHINSDTGNAQLRISSATGNSAGISLASDFYSSINAETVDLDFNAVAEGKSIKFRNQDTVNMVIKSTGNVGIGTENPGNKLQLNTEGLSTEGLKINADDSKEMIFYASKGAGHHNSLVQAGDSGIIFNEGSIGSGNLVIGPWTSGKYGIRINDVGQIGVGVALPDAQLQVKGNLATALTGTVATTNASATVTGTGTAFDTELAAGDAIKIGDEVFTIASISSATSLTVDSNSTVTASGVTAYSDPNLFALEDGDGNAQLTIDKSGNTTIDGDLTVTGTSTLSDMEISTNKISAPLGSDMKFQTGPSAGSLSDTMIISSDGRVGIGTPPDTQLTLVQSGGGASDYIHLRDSTDTRDFVVRYDGDVWKFMSETGGGGKNFFSFQDGTGNVGIGTTSPAAKLHLSGTGDTEFIVEADSDNSAGEDDNPTIILRQDGNLVNGLVGLGDGVAPRFSGALLNTLYIESKDTGGGGGIQFVTGSRTLGGTDGSARMTIDMDGNVGIGTTSPNANLDINGALRVGNDSLRMWGWSADSDIDLLLPGSTFGAITEGRSASHYVVGLRDNDGGDSFAVVSGGGNYDTDLTYDKLILYASANGKVGIGTNDPNRELQVDGRIKAKHTEPTLILSETDGNADENWWISVVSGVLGFNTVNDAESSWSRKISITQDGNVGIGEASPGNTLTVKTSATQYDGIKLLSSGGNAMAELIGSDASNQDALLTLWKNTGGSSKNVSINSSGNSYFNGGHVGIRVTSPAAPLDVQGSGGADIQKWRNSSGTGIAYLNDDAGDGRFQLRNSANGVKVFLDTGGSSYFTGGNVGIGTTSPASLFHLHDSSTPVATISTDGTAATNQAVLSLITKGDGAQLGSATNKGWNIAGRGDSYDGSQDNNLLFSYWNGSGWQSPFRITDAGQIGISTTEPNTKLHVVGPILSEGGSYTARPGTNNDTRPNVAMVMDRGDAIVFEHDGSLRNILEVNSTGNIKIGQDNTALVTSINLYPGTSGSTVFYSGNSEVMRVTGGNVGIGTDSPTDKFNVSVTGNAIARFDTSATDYGRIITNAPLNADAQISFMESGTTRWTVGNDGSDDDKFKIRLGAGAFGSNDKFTLDTAGNVGIGTSSPEEELHVAGNLILANGQYDIGVDSDDALQIGKWSADYTTFTEWMRIKTDGNVGIGTTNPTKKLDINGDTIRLRTAKTPASSAATCAQGEIVWDANYVYVCVATDTWKRSSLASW